MTQRPKGVKELEEPNTCGVDLLLEGSILEFLADFGRRTNRSDNAVIIHDNGTNLSLLTEAHTHR